MTRPLRGRSRDRGNRLSLHLQLQSPKPPPLPLTDVAQPTVRFVRHVPCQGTAQRTCHAVRQTRFRLRVNGACSSPKREGERPAQLFAQARSNDRLGAASALPALHTDLLKPRREIGPRFVRGAVVRPMHDLASLRHAKVVAIVFNEWKPVSWNANLVPCCVGELEYVEIAAPRKNQCGLEQGIFDVAATLEKFRICGREAEVQLAFRLGDLGVCRDTKWVGSHD